MAIADPADSTSGWEQRFRIPRTLWARAAPLAPSRGLVASSVTGTYQLHAWDIDTGLDDPLTDDPSGQVSGTLAPDGRWIVWHEDTAGDERGHYLLTPWPGGERRTLGADLPAMFSFTAGFSPAGSMFASPGLTGETWQILVALWAADGPAEPRLLDAGPGFVSDVAADDDGVVAYTTTGEAGTLATMVRVLRVGDGTLVREIHHPGAAVSAAMFAPDGSGRLLASTTRSGQVRPLIVGPDGDERELEMADVGGDLRPTDWSRDGRTVLLLGSDRSTTRLSVVDVETGAWRPIPHPPGAVAIGSPVAGAASFVDNAILTTIEDGTRPPAAVLLDPRTGAVLRTLLEPPPGPLSRPWRSIAIPSTDGAVVQGWLATPEGSPPFATIIDVHGGPAAQENDRFYPAAQAWLDRGYAVLLLNYRGSAGFGSAYEQAIWGDPGRRELDDMAAARDLLVRDGIADPGAVVPTGGSYGGYLTLFALAARPELWAAGVAYVAIGDWTAMYEEGEALRAYQEGLFGGPPGERAEVYARASPITYVSRLRAPLRIVQGRNDPRCPPGQLERFVDAARALGRPVEIDWFDAGHGHGGSDQRIAWQRQDMEFVDRALGRSA